MASSTKSSISSKSSKSSKTPNPPLTLDSFFPPSRFYPRIENNCQFIPELFKTNFDVIVQILLRHPISYALTGFPNVPEAYVHQLWHTLKFRSNTRPPRFEATIANVDIQFDQSFLRSALHLPLPDNRPGKTSFDPLSTKKQLCEDIVRLGYNASLPNLTKFTRGNLPPIYYSLFSLLNKCLSSKAAIDRAAKGIHYTLQGVVFDKHYDFSTSVWDEMIKVVRQRNDNKATAKKFLPFPRFFAMIIFEKLQQHPEIPRFPDEDTIYVENVTAFKELMASATAIPMILPRSVLDYADQEAHSVREYVSAHYPPMNQPEPAGSNRGGTQITPSEGPSRPSSHLKIRIKRTETVEGEPIPYPATENSDDERTESGSANKQDQGDTMIDDDNDDNDDDDDMHAASAALLSIHSVSPTRSFHDDILDVDDPNNLPSDSTEIDPVASLVPYSDDDPITPREDIPTPILDIPDDPSVDILFDAATPLIDDAQSADSTLQTSILVLERQLKFTTDILGETRNITREVVDPNQSVVLQNHHIPTPTAADSPNDSFNTNDLFVDAENVAMSAENVARISYDVGTSIEPPQVGMTRGLDGNSISANITPTMNIGLSTHLSDVPRYECQGDIVMARSLQNEASKLTVSLSDASFVTPATETACLSDIARTSAEITQIVCSRESPGNPVIVNITPAVNTSHTVHLSDVSVVPTGNLSGPGRELFTHFQSLIQKSVTQALQQAASLSDKDKQVVTTVNQPVQLVNPDDLSEQQLRDLLLRKLMSRQSSLSQDDVQLANLLSSSKANLLSSSSKAVICTQDDLQRLEERLMSRMQRIEKTCRPQALAPKRKHDDPDSEGPHEGKKRLRVLGGLYKLVQSIDLTSKETNTGAGSSSQHQQTEEIVHCRF